MNVAFSDEDVCDGSLSLGWVLLPRSTRQHLSGRASLYPAEISMGASFMSELRQCIWETRDCRIWVKIIQSARNLSLFTTHYRFQLSQPTLSLALLANQPLMPWKPEN